jgi:EAL domain-containing protein (putative c-di-GMP-specific phosphodiesterase class I)/cellulose synthase/poly-beta-1,6-N-acetylglucosamine synthase-like glycosyltransferase
MPVVSKAVSERRVAMARLAIVVTVLAWFAYLGTWLSGEFFGGQSTTARGRTEAVLYLIIVSLLTSSALAYLVCRLGFLYRTRTHHRTPKATIDEFFDHRSPTLTMIVPSYQEDARVIRNTLLSAALQEYPHTRIVLLIDDPPSPRLRRHHDLLIAARALPRQLEELLAEPSLRFSTALQQFESAMEDRVEPSSGVMTDLAEHYELAASWLRGQADGQEIVDHTDAFFANEVLRRLADDLAMTATALRAALAEGVLLPSARILQFYRRLAWTFSAELSSFERKQYASLSHEPNKAMNLNSYIGLMGGSYREIVTVAGRVLIPAAIGASDLDVPNPDYVLTLDADSVLLPEYCLRLVHLLEQSQHQKVAIAQTPYSAYPGSGTRLERIAGATTDLQHIVHQGLTYYDATFWVGANAVIRKTALDEIGTSSYIGDWEIRHFVQDRTVIEDTDSTIDLGLNGWSLINSPERLSYSATPPDFGSLCIQRKRWSNGGLIILPKVWQQLRQRRRRGERTRFAELALRSNYMASTFWSSMSLLILLVFPFGATLITPLLGLIALPYFIAMASDLKYCGYKRLDVFRIYGFNLMLVPVNLAGAASSMAQVLTGEKSPFTRTPKVRNRTVAPLFFVITPYLMVALAGYTFYVAYYRMRWENMVYGGLNVLLVSYGIVAFIGLRNSVGDVWAHLRQWLSKPDPKRQGRMRRRKSETPAEPPMDWRSVLQFGGADPAHWPVSGPSTLVVRPLGPSGVFAGRAAGIEGSERVEVTHHGTSAGDGDRAGASASPVGSADARPLKVGPGTPGMTGDQHDRRVHGDGTEDDGAGRRVDFRTVFQPILDLRTDSIVGYEALTRFTDGRGPERQLAEALSSGVAIELEAALVESAIDAAGAFIGDAWLAVNASSRFVVADTTFRSIVERAPFPVVVELREPVTIHIDRALQQVTSSLPPNASLAIDNAGLDHKSLVLIAQLQPRYVKLDRSRVAGIDHDAARQAQVVTVVSVADSVGASVVATGIETDAELATLRDLGVQCGQGFLLGRPSELVNA